MQILDLEDNGIDWQQALRLSALPSLTRLQLSHNPITEVTYPAATQPLPSASSAAAAAGSAANGAASSANYTTPAAASASATSATPSTAAETAGPGLGASKRPAFAKLSTLLLGHCQISSWRCVDQLARFPALADLRLSDNPLLADAKSGGRFEVSRGLGRRAFDEAVPHAAAARPTFRSLCCLVCGQAAPGRGGEWGEDGMLDFFAACSRMRL